MCYEKIRYYYKNEGYKIYRDRMKTLKRAARNNNGQAQMELAEEYIYSDYINPNINKAMRLIKKAQKNGIVNAKDYLITKENAISKYGEYEAKNNTAMMKYIDKKFLNKMLPF